VAVNGHGSAQPRFDLVVIVASRGGLPVISTVLAGLPQSFPVPVLVMQHRPGSTEPGTLPRLLGRNTAIPVRCATGMTAFPPGVTVIPGGYVAAVDRAGHLRLTESRVLGADGLLVTAAETSAHGAVIGVVLSGMLRDGAEGVRAVKRHGGRVLTQDPATAEAPSAGRHRRRGRCRWPSAGPACRAAGPHRRG
jgi:two-component system chemotaxis response regulator CheB